MAPKQGSMLITPLKSFLIQKLARKQICNTRGQYDGSKIIHSFV